MPQTYGPGDHGTAAQRCACRGTIAISMQVSDRDVVTLHSCTWCGTWWDINGAPAEREAACALIPLSDSPLATWRRAPVRRHRLRGHAPSLATERALQFRRLRLDAQD